MTESKTDSQISFSQEQPDWWLGYTFFQWHFTKVSLSKSFHFIVELQIFIAEFYNPCKPLTAIKNLTAFSDPGPDLV